MLLHCLLINKCKTIETKDTDGAMKAAWMQKMVSDWGFAWRVARRFVAGSAISDAIKAVKDLNSLGINATLDHLGESTTTRQEAIRAADSILDLLDQVERSGIRANISIKLTQVGLMIDRDICDQNLQRILARSEEYGNFIRLDMEDSACTEATIHTYEELRQRGFEKVGLAVQAYLYRSKMDVESLLRTGTRMRLVKGAYQEPEDIAFPKKADVDMNFDLLTQTLLDGALKAGAPSLSADGRIPPIPALGTHDERRIRFAKNRAMEIGLPKQALEFQMLYGFAEIFRNNAMQRVTLFGCTFLMAPIGIRTS